MDYEQKYKEALERASKLRVQNPFDTVGQMVEHIFPELQESKDEVIRKAIISCCIDHGHNYQFPGITAQDMLAWLEKQEEPEDKGEISDGYHTFNELYRYRMLYNAAFFNLLPKYMVHKSKRHHDGEECFGGGWFIVMANLPTGQISNHYELKDWDLFQIPEKDVADEWDGHTPQEAADRLHKYLLEKQSERAELDEIEDESIRKVLFDFFQAYKDKEEWGITKFNGIPTDNIIAWLEKQGHMLDPDKVVEWMKHYNITDCDVRTSIIPDSSPTSNPHRVRWLSDDFINRFKKDFGL